MAGVFVNYRTGDGEWPARLIAKELAVRFGDDQVFYASNSIAPGTDFAAEIRRRLLASDVLLAVIGHQWLAAENGRRKIDDVRDWVRHEIRLAFENDIRVIPVLVDDPPRLAESNLPADIAKLAGLHYLHVRHRHRNDDDFTTLVNELVLLMSSGPAEPWRVCVRDTQGAVRGAGVALGDRHVLTCAHVLQDAGDEVVVDFVGLRDEPAGRARVVPEWCVWPRADQRGDVALLELVRPRETGAGAMLRRMALSWDRTVRVCGFPSGLETGVYTRARLAGNAGPGGEWLQMNARSAGEQRIGAGFSGAGVVDDRTGDVLGIVVGEYTDEAASLSWMIPVETILHHLPRVREWVTGETGADKVFREPPAGDKVLVDEVQPITEWLSRRDSGDRLRIAMPFETAALYQAVSRSNPNGSAVGDVDLAIDASGRTTDDVARRVLDRSGTPLDGTVPPIEQVRAGVPPMTIVVTGTDDAKDPDELLRDVLRPLLEQGSRLLLVFQDSSWVLPTVREWRIGTVADRLARLGERIGAIEEGERELMSLRRHVRDHGRVDYRAPLLAVALAQVRKSAAEEGLAPELLDRCERKAAEVLRRTVKTTEQLREEFADRDALRGELAAYQAKANDDGLAEDLDVGAAYRAARAQLWRAPTDLTSAREAMRRYRQVIREHGQGDRT